MLTHVRFKQHNSCDLTVNSGSINFNELHKAKQAVNDFVSLCILLSLSNPLFSFTTSTACTRKFVLTFTNALTHTLLACASRAESFCNQHNGLKTMHSKTYANKVHWSLTIYIICHAYCTYLTSLVIYYCTKTWIQKKEYCHCNKNASPQLCFPFKVPAHSNRMLCWH